MKRGGLSILGVALLSHSAGCAAPGGGRPARAPAAEASAEAFTARAERLVAHIHQHLSPHTALQATAGGVRFDLHFLFGHPRQGASDLRRDRVQMLADVLRSAEPPIRVVAIGWVSDMKDPDLRKTAAERATGVSEALLDAGVDPNVLDVSLEGAMGAPSAARIVHLFLEVAAAP